MSRLFWRLVFGFAALVCCITLLYGQIRPTPPCACEVLSRNPKAEWHVEEADTPYLRGTAGYIEGRDSGYLSFTAYTCGHGARLAIYYDPDSDKCWGSIQS